MAAHTITNPSHSEYIGTYNKSSPPIDIKSMRKLSSSKYALGRGDQFPTDRRPEKRELSTETDDVVTEWFTNSQIHLRVHADTPEKQSKARRLFYTWRDCFAENIEPPT